VACRLLSELGGPWRLRPVARWPVLPLGLAQRQLARIAPPSVARVPSATFDGPTMRNVRRCHHKTTKADAPPVPGSYASRRPTSNHLPGKILGSPPKQCLQLRRENGSVFVLRVWWARIIMQPVSVHTFRHAPQQVALNEKDFRRPLRAWPYTRGPIANHFQLINPMMKRRRASSWSKLPNRGKSSENTSPRCRPDCARLRKQIRPRCLLDGGKAHFPPT